MHDENALKYAKYAHIKTITYLERKQGNSKFKVKVKLSLKHR